jgi:hypothetical protein
MALGNFTKVAGPYTLGSRFESDYTFDWDNSYTTGGLAITPSQVGFANTADPDFRMAVSGKSGYQFVWDGSTFTAQKVLAYVPTAVYTATFDPASLASVTSRNDAITVTGVAATDVCVRVDPPPAVAASVVVQEAVVTGTNTVTVRLTNPSAGAVDVASGTWTFYIAGANGTLHEVPNGTDLSALTGVHVRARGRFRG